MIQNNDCMTILNSPVRKITAKVEAWSENTLAYSFESSSSLINLNLSRVGEGKFFGYGICQRLNIHVIDLKRNVTLTTSHTLKVYFNDICFFPDFHITEVNRDENTNELSITAYDALTFAPQHTVAELNLEAPYSIEDFALSIVSLLGFKGLKGTFPELIYEEGANFDGTEQLRDVLDSIAETNQSIYYLDAEENLVFKNLDKDGEAVYTIDKSKYFELNSRTNRRLGRIVHVTDLGDNVGTTSTEGSTQYIRNNPFWDLRDDIGTLLEDAIEKVGNLTIHQFDCEWRGNFLLEIGDKIALVTKDNELVESYVLNDVMDYDGAFIQSTEWDYESEEEESSNPTDLGDVLKDTYAKVDKANKQIDLVAKDVKENSENIAAIQVTANEISSSVESLEKNVDGSLDSMGQEIESLSKKVSASMTAEDVQLEIRKELISNGTTSVTTTTGFTFNEDGMTVSKSDSEMTTTITEDGMKIYRNDDEVLTVNNAGVDAENLHATTYLIIGRNSRFEDYGARTGCFWIGD